MEEHIFSREFVSRVIIALCDLIKEKKLDCRWFAAKMIAIGSGLEGPGFVSSCSEVFDV